MQPFLNASDHGCSNFGITDTYQLEASTSRKGNIKQPLDHVYNSRPIYCTYKMRYMCVSCTDQEYQEGINLQNEM